MTTGKNSSLLRIALAFTATSAACENEAVLPLPIEPGPTNQYTVNASSTTTFSYFDLATGTQVQPGSPQSSDAWDLALRRYEVRLNGGVAGSKGVSGALVVDNSSQSAATILAYTPANQLASFEAMTAEDIPASTAFTSMGLAEDRSGWFAPAGATLVANPSRAWKVYRADGGYAVIRVASLTLTGNNLTAFTVEYRLQTGPSGTLGTVQSVSVTPGAPGSPTRISLASGSAVTTSGCTWDLAIAADLAFTVNTDSSCPTGTFPVDGAESFTALTTAAGAPSYAKFVSAFSGPVAYSVDASRHPPFLYNIDTQNPNRLSPTFNVYLIRTGNSVYKVQFLSYYNPTGGESGYLTFRTSKIQ